MRKRLLASLIVCVALVTQFGASLWGAATARDGLVGCHKNIAWSATADVTPSRDTARDTARETSSDTDRAAPAQSPSKPDHACCSLCQLSFGFLKSEAPVFETRTAAYRRVLLAEPAEPARLDVFNRGAPARAPPSQA